MKNVQSGAFKNLHIHFKARTNLLRNSDSCLHLVLFAFATLLTLTPFALPLALPLALTAAGSALLAFAVLLLLLLLCWLIILTIDVVVVLDTGVVAARGISAGVGPGTLAAAIGVEVTVGGRTSNVGLHMASAGLVCRPTFLGHMATMLAPIGPGEGMRGGLLDDLVE